MSDYHSSTEHDAGRRARFGDDAEAPERDYADPAGRSRHTLPGPVDAQGRPLRFYHDRFVTRPCQRPDCATCTLSPAEYTRQVLGARAS
jgi:hypothetical protein